MARGLARTSRQLQISGSDVDAGRVMNFPMLDMRAYALASGAYAPMSIAVLSAGPHGQEVGAVSEQAKG